MDGQHLKGSERPPAKELVNPVFLKLNWPRKYFLHITSLIIRYTGQGANGHYLLQLVGCRPGFRKEEGTNNVLLTGEWFSQAQDGLGDQEQRTAVPLPGPLLLYGRTT